ncbi:ArsR/SmtB family transcription factor [Aurantiacibacter gangjinensis]|uniref:ArsR family transcriptional regulator n=1 Tax=Aurantiacibacter gangjinensis TaxID=502682 RepID=A0A0G9MSK9_9SPHN|nr:metalloregulator ArsR/SmtB family transcription factor [Aurantiacibacter gangjinensis]APE29124.1 Transcriptional regulator, ArsR family / Methyltransferase fusion [Aurantiacibacter gangjinensis]KLE33675.1 ArsR family transcriptional regulator [Aurantiacibacter gangjinensis]
MQTESILRALADPTRMRIMRLVQRMELSVGELAQVLGQSQPRVSQHVAKLVDSGLVHRHREGSWVFLRCATRAAGTPLHDAAARLLATAENEDESFGEQCRSDRDRLGMIRTAREADAQDYFARHADEWDEMRAMLGPGEPVESAILAALDGHAPGRLADIGTGTGRIAELLVKHTDHLVGVDKSPDMLRLARARLQHVEESIELVQGDFSALPFPAASFDTVVFHQVLHFAADLAAPLAEAARICRPGGRIVIADLAAHTLEDMRSRHAHTRLGFTADGMAEALRAAGFEPHEAVELGGSQLVTMIWTATRCPASPSNTDTARTIAR